MLFCLIVLGVYFGYRRCIGLNLIVLVFGVAC